jgi:hypothetical protein
VKTSRYSTKKNTVTLNWSFTEELRKIVETREWWNW